MMGKYIVSARIEGTAWVEVEADSEEQAIEKSHGADGWEIDDWDINDSLHRGGYIDAEKMANQETTLTNIAQAGQAWEGE